MAETWVSQILPLNSIFFMMAFLLSSQCCHHSPYALSSVSWEEGNNFDFRVCFQTHIVYLILCFGAYFILALRLGIYGISRKIKEGLHMTDSELKESSHNSYSWEHEKQLDFVSDMFVDIRTGPKTSRNPQTEFHRFQWGNQRFQASARQYVSFLWINLLSVSFRKIPSLDVNHLLSYWLFNELCSPLPQQPYPSHSTYVSL